MRSIFSDESSFRFLFFQEKEEKKKIGSQRKAVQSGVVMQDLTAFPAFLITVSEPLRFCSKSAAEGAAQFDQFEDDGAEHNRNADEGKVQFLHKDTQQRGSQTDIEQRQA